MANLRLRTPEPLLMSGVDHTELACFLRHEVQSHFGLNPTDEIESVADQLISWWSAAVAT